MWSAALTAGPQGAQRLLHVVAQDVGSLALDGAHERDVIGPHLLLASTRA